MSKKYIAEIIYLDDKKSPKKRSVSYASLDEAKVKSIMEESTYLRIKITKDGGTECTTFNPLNVLTAWMTFCGRPAYENILMVDWGIFTIGTSVEKITDWFERTCPDVWKIVAADQYCQAQKKTKYKRKQKDYEPLCGKTRVHTHDGVYRLVRTNDDSYGILHSYRRNVYGTPTQEICFTADTKEEAENRLAEIRSASKPQKPFKNARE